MINPMRHKGNVDEAPAFFSLASGPWNALPAVGWANICLRLIVLVLSLATAVLSLTAASPRRAKLRKYSASFKDYPGLLYLLAISTIAIVYEAFQLFKALACDNEQGGILISHSLSDYMSFISDMLIGYLLLSGNSATIAVIQRMYDEDKLRVEAIISVCFSLASFVVNEGSILLSGYMVWKRIMR